MRWAKSGLAVALAIVAAAAVALAMFDAEKFRPAIEEQLTKALGRRVRLGRISNSWIPPGARVEGLQVGEDPRFGTGAFLTAREFTATAKLAPLLLSRRVEISSITLVQPDIELIRRGSTWNYESLGGSAKKDENSASPSVDLVEIRGAQIAVTTDSSPRVVYPRADAVVDDIAPGRARFTVSAAGGAGEVGGKFEAKGEYKDGRLTSALTIREARYAKSSFGDVSMNVDKAGDEVRAFELAVGKLAVRARGTLKGKELSLDVELPRAPVADLLRLAAAFGQGLPGGLQAEGSIEGKFQLRGTTDEPSVTGRIQAGELKLSGGPLKQEVRSRAVTIDLLPEAIRSTPFEVTSAGVKLSGYFSVRNYATRPLLESAVLTDRSDIAVLLQIAQAYGLAAPDWRGTGNATLHLRIHGPLSKGGVLQYAGKGTLENSVWQTPKMAAPVKFDRADLSFPNTSEGTVSVGRLEYQRLSLTGVRANTSYRAGVLRLDPLTANLFAGAVRGSMAIDTRGADNSIVLDTRLEKIESSQLMSAISSLPQIVSGPLAADVKLTVAPRANEDPLRGMSGRVGLAFAGGQLHTLNLLGALNTVAKFIGGPKLEGKTTRFLALQGELALDKGVARTGGLKLDLAGATATFAGTMDFAGQSLDMKSMSILSPKLAEELGGTRIGGYLTAALRNAAGELIIPALVSGTFAQPRLLPDGAAIAKLKLQTAVPGVIDAVRSGKGGLKNVLDILGAGAQQKRE